MSPDTDQSLANLRLERDAVILYEALAEIDFSALEGSRS